MDGWMGERTDGCTGGWVGGWICVQQTDRQTNERKNEKCNKFNYQGEINDRHLTSVVEGAKQNSSSDLEYWNKRFYDDVWGKGRKLPLVK